MGLCVDLADRANYGPRRPVLTVRTPAAAMRVPTFKKSRQAAGTRRAIRRRKQNRELRPVNEAWRI